MTHNDFDLEFDIIKPLMEFMKKAEFTTHPNEVRERVSFDSSLFVQP
jgi:hypothetical protein